MGTVTADPPLDVASVSARLQKVQRERAVVLKSRNMACNRLRALVAGTLGYTASMPEAERARKFKEAQSLIDEPARWGESSLESVIRVTCVGVAAFEAEKDRLEKAMVTLAKKLPAAKWVAQPEQKGFGLLFLAIVVGECGNLVGYANPAKVWRRMGCAPWTFDGHTKMGATWRGGREGKLPAPEWESYGYSPRRRSIAYLIGEGVVRQNRAGPYRTRYLEAKARAFRTHPEWDWKPCDNCKGSGKEEDASVCDTCGGTGKKCLRAHRHGMLLATKRLLLNLWTTWTQGE